MTRILSLPNEKDVLTKRFYQHVLSWCIRLFASLLRLCIASFLARRKQRLLAQYGTIHVEICTRSTKESLVRRRWQTTPRKGNGRRTSCDWLFVRTHLQTETLPRSHREPKHVPQTNTAEPSHNLSGDWLSCFCIATIGALASILSPTTSNCRHTVTLLASSHTNELQYCTSTFIYFYCTNIL